MRKAVFAILLGIILIGITLSVERYYRLKSPISLGKTETTQTKTLPIAQLLRFADQQSVSLESFKGKVTLINFWASWCSSCIIEMPSINKLYETLKSEGFEVIALNVDERPKDVVPPLIKKLDLKFQIYTDPKDELVKYFDVMAIPFSVVLGRDLKVLWAESGERDWATPEIINEIRAALTKQ